jgi:ElaB/YqjD/DUF883 family membrane-anchored ribosome-binding protein
MSRIHHPVAKNGHEKHHGGDHSVAEDFEALKDSVFQLRSDVDAILTSAVGVGKSSVTALKETAAGAVEDLKDQGQLAAVALEKRIARNPLGTAAVAVGIGFILAKLMRRK